MTELKTPGELSELFATEKLPLPGLPAALMQRLLQVGPQLWASESGLPHPEDLPQWIRLAQRHDGELLQIGFSGRGINSWSLHLNLVQKGLAVFLQCRWGNAYDDAAVSRRRIEGVMGFIDMMLLRCAKPEANALVESGERLIVCFADHFPSRWQWRSEGDQWHQDGDFTLLAAVGSLDRRIEGVDESGA